MSEAGKAEKNGIRRGWGPALATVAGGWIMAGAICQLGLRKTDQIDRTNYERSVGTIRELLETHVEKFESALGRMATFATFRVEGSQGEWLEMLESIDPKVNFRYVSELGVARFHAGLWPYPTKGGHEGHQAYRWAPITFKAVGPEFEAARTGDELVPNEAGLHQVIAEAIKTASPRLGEAFHLTNAAGGDLGRAVTMYMTFNNVTVEHWTTAIKERGKEAEAARVNYQVKHREGHFAGIVFGTINLKALVRGVFGEGRMPVEFELHSGPEKSAESRVDGRRFAADGSSRFDSWSDQSWYTHKYYYRCYTTPEFEAQSPRRLVFIVSWSVAAVTLALAAFVRAQTVGRMRAESIAALREEGRLLIEAAGQEKERLSRDLHDGAVQAMYATILTLKRALNELGHDAGEAKDQIQTSITLLDGAITELRALLVSLAPSPLAGEVLVNSLNTLVQTMNRANSIRVVLEGETEPLKSLDSQTGVELLNLLREAISNALRHSEARTIRLRTGLVDGRIAIEVRDDGCGFDPAHAPQAGHGLANMKARSERMGARVEFESVPGQGTTIRLVLPAGEAEAGGTVRAPGH